MSLYPAGASNPTASVVNFAAGETRANSILARLGTSGKVTVYSPVETDIVVSVGFQTMVHNHHRVSTQPAALSKAEGQRFAL